MGTSTPHHPSFLRPRGSERVLDLGRLLLGLTVVTLGVLLLLDSAGTLDAGQAIDDFWPLLLVAAGLLTLAERPPSLVRGWLLTGIGVLLLLFTADVVDQSAWDYVWPALIIGVGLLIVARWAGRTIPSSESGEDVIRATAVFGGPKLVSTTQHLQGAWLTAIFGGVTLDLRDARPAPEGASVNATVAFGGVDLLVPKGWRISVRSTPIFGGLDDKTDHSEPPAPDAPTLHVDALTVFGGVEIKHEK
jgi:cell wall-active antibiotic response 4TMS protein YvqF